MKILSAIITFVLLLLYSAALFFFLLVAMNGFSERQGMPVIIGYFIVAAISVFVSALASWLLTRKFQNGGMNAFLTVVLPALLFSILGAAVIFVVSVVLVAIGAEMRR
jgi:hypothetical protein